MRDLTFTVYRNAKDRWGTPQRLAWAQWVETFTKHTHRGSPSDSNDKAALNRAKDGPALILGEVAEGKPRAASHVREANAIGIDIEGHDEDAIAAGLQALAPYEYALWTTHKSGADAVDGGTRLRVVVPFAEPITPSDYSHVWAALDALIGRINDPATRDISRLHYFPSTFDPSKAWSHHNATGRFISVEDIPDADTQRHETRPETPRQAAKVAERIKAWLRTLPKEHPQKDAASSLSKGLPFAEDGDRHNTLVDLTWLIADKNPNLGPMTLEGVFAGSLKVMADESPNDHPTIDEVIEAYDGAVQKIAEFQEEERQRKKAEEKKQLAEEQAGGNLPYTDEDFERIAKRNGWEVDELKRRWIIYKGQNHWILGPDGDYINTIFNKDDLPGAYNQYLSRSPCQLIRSTKEGWDYRPASHVLRENGTVVNRIVSDMTIQRHTFEPDTLTMREAITPIRPLEPEFDETIDKWLRILAGAQYGKLVDWLSVVPDLKKLLCAVYFEGDPGSGKTLIAHGLAKLWTTGGPAEIEKVLGDFNDEIAKCPMILADEEIPRPRNSSTVTAKLRTMLSTMSRTLSRKYLSNTSLYGAIRMVLAANNEFLLDSSDVSSANDLTAIAQRFLYIQVPTEATEFMNQLPRATREYWGEAGIAKHALWLNQNHEVKEPGKRFWVEGDISQMHRRLMTNTTWNSRVLGWLVAYGMKPQLFDTQGTGLMRRGEGEFLVNEQALVDHWELYSKAQIDPEIGKISAALRSLAKTKRRKQLRYQGVRQRYRVIDIDHLLQWSDDNNYGDRETLLYNLHGEGEPPGNDTATDELESLPGANKESLPS